MDMFNSSLSARRAIVVGVLAFLPVTWYALAGSAAAGIVSAASVALILACLYVAFGPADDRVGAATAS